MLAKDNRMALFMRIAAIILLLSLIMTALCDAAFYIGRELTYHPLTNGIKYLTRYKFDVIRLLDLLQGQVIPIVTALIEVCTTLVVVIMLFAAKEKPAGVTIIISAALVYAGKILAEIIEVFLFIKRYGFGFQVLFNSVKSAAEYTAVLVLMILLGLLLIGVFKKASKVVGFILLGLFVVVWLVNSFYFVRNIGGLFSITKPTVFNVMSAIINRLLLPVCTGMNYIAYALLSLGAALRKRTPAVAAE